MIAHLEPNIHQRQELWKVSSATEHRLMGTVPQARKMKPVLDTTEFNLDISAESKGKIQQQA